MILKLPWWMKVCIKLLLTLIPIPYGFWRMINLFRHGDMNNPTRAFQTFEKYYVRACSKINLPTGFKVLELGPGDSILSGLVARSFGASEVWLVDAGAFAETDTSSCHRMQELLTASGHKNINLEDATTLDEILARGNIHYLTQGTASLANIPDASVDLFWSQVVLEHVPKYEFTEFLTQLRRIVKPDGIGVHSVDFRDHLGGALNNLRFPENTWESHLFRRSGFYTNRIRPYEMLRMFEAAGFQVDVPFKTYWSEMPTSRKWMVLPFRDMPERELKIAEYEVHLTLPASNEFCVNAKN